MDLNLFLKFDLKNESGIKPSLVKSIELYLAWIKKNKHEKNESTNMAPYF
jgi:hypothetical protein